ncbi:CC0125/CC1285 family lipoprotein [Tahibacter soli]|uniref:Lipoprotein n=1 Tax=Tahibacter soli TaxID=2983605 RepID=A0A9X3YL37_9GAMM|nr:hypothetical protein [Tahibacter soli]MDC8012678.1 hypothetical protein [Tahibacter soli]
MNSKLAGILSFVTLLSACATTYQRTGFSGGFSETQLAPDVFRVSFSGNGFTTPERVQDFAMLRAAELCSGVGHPYFAVVDSVDQSVTQNVTMPGMAQTTGQVNVVGNTAVYSGTTTYSPVQTYSFYKPGVGMMVRCLREQIEGSMTFDAQFLSTTIRAKYGL